METICIKMSHKSEIGLHLSIKPLCVSPSNTLIHILFRTIANIGSPRFDIGSEEENTMFARVQNNLSLMELESELLVKKITNLGNYIFQNLPIRMKKYHIIHIPSVVFDVESVFYEMIQFVKVEISEKLTHEVSEWQSSVRRC